MNAFIKKLPHNYKKEFSRKNKKFLLNYKKKFFATIKKFLCNYKKNVLGIIKNFSLFFFFFAWTQYKMVRLTRSNKNSTNAKKEAF